MKIVQIATIKDSLFALTEEGSLWTLDTLNHMWTKCQKIQSNEEQHQIKSKGLISDLALSNRVLKALRHYGIETVGDLLLIDENELKSIPRLGKKSQFELRSALVKLKTQF